MPIIKQKGKVSQPFAGKFNGPVTKSVKSSNLPLFFGLVFLGAGLVLWMRAKDHTTFTGPALTLTPSYAADESTVANMRQAVQAMGTTHNLPVGGSGSSGSGTGSAPPPSQTGSGNVFGSYPTGYRPPEMHPPYIRDPVPQVPATPVSTSRFSTVDMNALRASMTTRMQEYLNAHPQLKARVNGS